MTRQIVNLTQHPATPDQIAAGVYDLTGADLDQLRTLLTFDTLPTKEEIRRRAIMIVDIILLHDTPMAMIGGAPWLMPILEDELRNIEVTPIYAFSARQTEEVPQDDGSVKKVNVFKHLGFVGLEN